MYVGAHIVCAHTYTQQRAFDETHSAVGEVVFFFLTTEVMPTHVGCPSENKTVMLPQEHPETE